jgi:hypothetical protein
VKGLDLLGGLRLLEVIVFGEGWREYRAKLVESDLGF